MTEPAPAGELDSRFSSEGAAATRWSDVEAVLSEAAVFWISTVRPDGRPHVTPLISVWLDGTLYFCTGPDERKAKNLSRNPHCALTTGCNIEDGLDVVVEGEAVRLTDDSELQQLADAYVAKYGEVWRFGVRDGAFVHGTDERSVALVFEVAPAKVLAFGKGAVFSQTRWVFER
jgi:nitroimidazol reductase NimA-like FMN-containing flavoprotein (pyridoxamine 5'-phosphate oxidase superfamily)